MTNINILISDEAARLNLDQDNNLSINASLRMAAEMYKEKAQNLTDQSIGNEHAKLFNNIIPPGTNIDNGELYDEKGGQTIRDL